jgi:hypothetical protein
MTTTGTNNSYVLWCYTDGTASIWQLDANLNLVTSRNWGPITGWTAQALGLDNFDNIRLIWKSTLGQYSAWTINAALNPIGGSPVYGPYRVEPLKTEGKDDERTAKEIPVCRSCQRGDMGLCPIAVRTEYRPCCGCRISHGGRCQKTASAIKILAGCT